MAEYIERGDIIKNWIAKISVLDSAEEHLDALCEVIGDLSAADVAPVMHGRWIRQKGDPGATCSHCGRDVVYQEAGGRWAYENYCPHCGWKMDE